MIFNSITYIIFLTIFIFTYWYFTSTKIRTTLIFSASLAFYGFWKINFIPVMLFSVILDYFMALEIEKSDDTIKKKKFLLISLVGNLGLLFYFKYLIFFANNAIGFINLMGLSIDPIFFKIILPLGISFYTFQTISYTVDVYRGHIKPEKNFLLYASYVTFFPQLIAGPILRAEEVIQQLASNIRASSKDLYSGFKRIIYGLFLKVILADNIAPLVDVGFNSSIAQLSAIDIWTLSFLFGFQIYFDFSAYSHIAIGSARMLGIKFPENFNFPYIASSPKDFWKRWHISLSSWIRDYLYLPLTGATVIKKSSSLGGLETAVTQDKRDKALFLTWAIMGLWHGASWTFVLWGIYHAAWILIFRSVNKINLISAFLNFRLGGFLVTLPIMMLGWIPFRADSMEVTFAMWAKVIDFSAYGFLSMRENAYLIAAVLLTGFIITFVTQPYLKKFHMAKPNLFRMLEIIFLCSVVPFILIFLRPISQFIYFQF
jgi:alginate O-acetyltransferase complex protein AlgI